MFTDIVHFVNATRSKFPIRMAAMIGSGPSLASLEDPRMTGATNGVKASAEDRYSITQNAPIEMTSRRVS